MNADNKTHHQTPMMLMNDCARLFRHQMRKFADDAGVPDGYRTLLMHLAFAKKRGEDSIIQYELAKHTHLTPPTVSVTLQKMERDGYITRVSDETDMRQMRVSLTDKGLAVDLANHRKAQELEALATAGMSENDLAELTRLLGILYDNLCQGANPQKPCGKE